MSVKLWQLTVDSYIRNKLEGNRFCQATLFEGVFKNLLPSLRTTWYQRNQRPLITLRLIEVRSGKTWHSYLTNVLDPTVLPPYVVADLYRRRWRIEEAFNTVKRLLGLSYLWTGS